MSKGSSSVLEHHIFREWSPARALTVSSLCVHDVQQAVEDAAFWR